MTQTDVIRAWRDEDYRETLAESERSALPRHPAGAVELSESGLGQITGGYEIPETSRPWLCTEETSSCPSICQVFSC